MEEVTVVEQTEITGNGQMQVCGRLELRVTERGHSDCILDMIFQLYSCKMKKIKTFFLALVFLYDLEISFLRSGEVTLASSGLSQIRHET